MTGVGKIGDFQPISRVETNIIMRCHELLYRFFSDLKMIDLE